MEVVNVVWLCKILTKRNHKKYFVKVGEKSVYSLDNGWLCDCGHWTNGEDGYHVPIERGYRAVYEDLFLK